MKKRIIYKSSSSPQSGAGQYEGSKDTNESVRVQRHAAGTPVCSKKWMPSSAGQLIRDLSGGVIVALISIPISMGYAQIAGLPMQYGLYGSVFPIILFGLLTSSRDFVFGVDAAPAALVGGLIASMGIAEGSPQAMTVVPTLTFFTALWLLLFCMLRAGRIVRYISSAVMGGFVTGICCTIILMQFPKLFGGTAGTGEAPELIVHIVEQLPLFHPVSFGLSVLSVALIMMAKRWVPKLPMSVIVMAAAAAFGCFFPFESIGVKLLPHVDAGLPAAVALPSVGSLSELSKYLFSSLSVAAVILAESLLASGSNALKDGYRLDNNREIAAYAAANLAAALCGCCPVNASVSRTGIVRQFGVSSQWQSVAAGLSMVVVLFFAAPIIEYLPVPVLTAIVVSALMNACEFGEAVHFFRHSRTEFYIFMGAFLAVMIFGTVYGVMIGIVLSFVAVIIRAVTPPRDFLGVIDGKENSFYSLRRNGEAKPIQHTLIYRFGGNLFFANIDTLCNDIEKAVKEDTEVIIIHAGACGQVDITAAERLMMLYDDYRNRGIRLYITEHIGQVNDQLRAFGARRLTESGAVRMTTDLALRDAGIHYPYPTEPRADAFGSIVPQGQAAPHHISKRAKGIQPELEWVFGTEANAYRERIADELVEMLFREDITIAEFEDAEKHTFWGRVNMFDEDEILDRIEQRVEKEFAGHPERLIRLEQIIESRRNYIEKRMKQMDPEILKKLQERRQLYLERYTSDFRYPSSPHMGDE